MSSVCQVEKRKKKRQKEVRKIKNLTCSSLYSFLSYSHQDKKISKTHVYLKICEFAARTTRINTRHIVVTSGWVEGSHGSEQGGISSTSDFDDHRYI